MKRIAIVLAVFAASVMTIPCALCYGSPESRPTASPADDVDPGLTPPPTPYEYDIAETVFARFPGINRKEVDQFLQNNFAEELKSFRSLAVSRQAEATELFSRLVRNVLALLETKRTNPAIYEKKLKLHRLETAADRLVREIRLAGDKEKQKLQQALHETASAIFDVKQDLMKTDVEQMSRELALLKELIARREVNREAIVSQRITDLVGTKQDLEW
ncbi:MAG: hypothetical protein WCL44_01625 [bacterium]